MELERQVCSLKLAQRLRRLGVEQNSIWNWCKINHKWIVVWAYSEEPIKATQYAAAFTVAELGEMLPIVVEAGKAGTGISSELLSIQKGHFGNVGNDECNGRSCIMT
jgi:hypothetical protein